MFKCECGKEFESAQSFNGHKSSCRIHLEAKGINYDSWLKMKQTQRKLAGKTMHKNALTVQQTKLDQWVAEKHVCEHCGKVMTEKFGTGRFCCRACANARPHSDDTKQKISNSIAKLHSDKPEEKFCKICGAKLSAHNTSGLCQECFRENYPDEVKAKQSVKMKDKPRWNIHRNQTSFAEKFWENVLTNNQINFKREVAVKYDDLHCYFLDFEIIKNNIKIDLEIDGKQHQYRAEQDMKRDSFLSKTYLVYRIAWNDIKSDSGKLKMQEKISAFIEWYNTLN